MSANLSLLPFYHLFGLKWREIITSAFRCQRRRTSRRLLARDPATWHDHDRMRCFPPTLRV